MTRTLALAVVALTLSAAAREWFDGGINGHWPDLARGGEWTARGCGYFCGDAVRLNAELEDPAVFQTWSDGRMPQVAQSAKFETVTSLGFQKKLPDPSEFGKAALTVLKTGDGQYVYHVLEKDGATNRWVAVEGTPDVERRCTVSFGFATTAAGLRVTYKVDGVTLAEKDVVGASLPTDVCYAGGGDVASLLGTYDTDRARFELRTAPGTSVGSVSVAAASPSCAALTSGKDSASPFLPGSLLAYPYEVTRGSQVKVEYHAFGDACFPNGETTVSKTFTVASDGEVFDVPAEAMPTTAVARVKDTRYGSLAAAFAAAQAGDTITVLADCTGVLPLTLADRGAVTLDLNGHVVEGTGTGPLVTVRGTTRLTVVNGDVTATDVLRQTSDATLVAVDSGAVALDGRRSDLVLDDVTGAAFVCTGNGRVTVNGGAVFGRLDGSGITVNVYTNGNRFASARFSQDETVRLSNAARRKRLEMTQSLDGLWSVDRLLHLGFLLRLH